MTHSACQRCVTSLPSWKSPAATRGPSLRPPLFEEGIESLADLQPGMILEGVVTNVAAFGAFIDIGVHQDGLVHVSQLANKFVKDPHEIVKPGQVVKVRVMEVDEKRQRISLTMRLDDAPGSGSRSGEAPAETNTGGSRGPRDRRPPEPKRALARIEPKPDGAIALALERAKLKK